MDSANDDNAGKTKAKRKREDVEEGAALPTKGIKVPREIDNEEESSEEPEVKYEEPSKQDQAKYFKDIQDAREQLRKHFETPFLCARSGSLKQPRFIVQRAPDSG